jgi:hypothetical protein
MSYITILFEGFYDHKITTVRYLNKDAPETDFARYPTGRISSESECWIPDIRPDFGPVLWIRICKDPKLFAGSRTGCGTRGYGSGSGIGLKLDQKSSIKLAI